MSNTSSDTIDLANLQQKTQRAKTLTLSSIALLIVAFLLGNFWLTPPPTSLLFATSIQVLPLLIFMPGIARNNYRSCLWLCFVILLYFISYAVHLVNPDSHWLNHAKVVLISIIFISSMMCARWQQQVLNAEAAGAT